MTREEMQTFAADWIEAWNRRDVDGIVSHMADDVRFVSQLAIGITGGREVRGREALRTYWKEASARSHSLRFDLTEAICDVEAQTLVVVYTTERNGETRSAAEIMRFRDGRQISGEALYGAAL